MATPGWLIEFALDGGRVTHALTVNRSWCQLDEGHDTMHLEGQLAQAPAVPADPYQGHATYHIEQEEPCP